MAWFSGVEQPRILIAPSLKGVNEGKDKTTTANAQGQLLSLRHPKSDASTSYVFKDGSLQELHWFKQPYGSWFLGNYVCEDGSLYISTPADPIFIFLPLFADARMKKGSDQGMFRQLDEILYVEGYPGYQNLISMAEDSMHLVCEVKEVGSSKFFRLDNGRVLSWLCCKIHQLKASLVELDKNYSIQDERETLKEIIAILSEYLKDEPFLTLLCDHFKLSVDEILQKAPKNKVDPIIPDNIPASSYPLPEKMAARKNKSSNGRQSKKMKPETDSQNIKDMFCRSSRRKAEQD